MTGARGASSTSRDRLARKAFASAGLVLRIATPALRRSLSAPQ
jgi:hypothetical protein